MGVGIKAAATLTERGLRGLKRFSAVAGERVRQAPRATSGLIGRRMMNFVPSPGADWTSMVPPC